MNQEEDSQVYATISMKCGAVNLFAAMDDLMETIGESSDNNMVVYLSARIKHLKGLLGDGLNASVKE